MLFSFLCIFFSLSSYISAIDEAPASIPTINSEIACSAHLRPLNITFVRGYVVSPNYNDRGLTSYPDNASCSWTLIAPKDYIIMIKIKLMDLNDRPLSKARLSFYDGLDENGNIIDHFWGDRWRNFRSPTNVLHIKFEGEKRDGQLIAQHKGFKLYFEHQKAPVDCGKFKRCRNGEACILPENKCNGVDNCLDGTDEENCDKQSSSSHFAFCGLRKRIVGGQSAKPDSWPWLVSIRLAREEPEGHYCGGTLINNQWVITAAHCFGAESDPKVWTLNLGKNHKLIRDENEIIRYPKRIIIHPQYDTSLRDNDIALIKMNAPIDASNNTIRPICLPNKNLNLTDVASKRLFKIIGWGDTRGTSNGLILTEAEIPLIDNQLCKQWLGMSDISDQMICAGFKEGSVDTCNGDSGGPLMVFWKNHWTLIGTTSFGSICCGCPQSPGVYAKITHFLDWINDVITKS